MNLAEILHLCLISRKTGCVLFNREGDVGKLWLQEGQVHHAEFVTRSGEEAVYKMLELESGEASLIDLLLATKRTIHCSCEHLLMESARRADEKFKTRMIPLPTIHKTSSALSQSAPKLIQFNLQGEPLSHSLKLSKTTTGRAPHNDLCFTVDSVSSNHCVFEVRGQKVFLTDLQSLNGTFINGQRISEPQELHEGDTVHLGGLALRFYWMTKPDVALA
jgi:hypothetical protein